jgi:hypothetical protein
MAAATSTTTTTFLEGKGVTAMKEIWVVILAQDGESPELIGWGQPSEERALKLAWSWLHDQDEDFWDGPTGPEGVYEQLRYGEASFDADTYGWHLSIRKAWPPDED